MLIGYLSEHYMQYWENFVKKCEMCPKQSYLSGRNKVKHVI